MGMIVDRQNISMDRLYTSTTTTKWLLNKNITMIGTMQYNRSGIPKEIKSVDDWEDLLCRVHWANNDINFLSYVVKTKSGRRDVLLLSTMRPSLAVTKDDEKKKPAFYTISLKEELMSVIKG